MTLPQDPMILYSYINTQLRDRGCTLDDFCRSNSLDKNQISEKLSAVGFEYDSELRKFI